MSIMRKIVDFGRRQYATVQIRKGKWIYVAAERLRNHKIDWQRLTRLALSARIEAQ